MKTITTIFFISGWMISSSVSAQPTLTFSNNAPQPLEVYSCWPAPVIPPYSAIVATGANFTWDFTGIPPHWGTIYSHYDPIMTQFGSMYPNATVTCQEPLWWTTLVYLVATPGGLYEIGLNDDEWSDMRTRITYPFTYGSTYSDTAVYVPNNWAWYISGVADGYGTVLLPYGPVYNVLRISEIVNRYNGTTWIPEEKYSWYQEGTSTPICFYWQDPDTAKFFYRQPAVLIGNNDPDKGTGIHIFPNPFTSRLFVELPGNTNENFKLTVLDIRGRVIYEGTNSMLDGSLLNLDLGYLENGIYVLQLQTNNEVYQTRVVKQ